mmetsp:Transcript_28126/g.32115  ORF Transcript_28126/g.32115 Transcript_28126/m.32115 type:complete len:167 (-) Transcript_28126:286-786(-)
MSIDTSLQQKSLTSSYQNGTSLTKLYDDNIMLDMSVEKAKGYLVLLRGDGSDDARRLAFVALTDGNVIDACLGTNFPKREGVQYYLARQTKNILAEASDISMAIPKLAVESYLRGMTIIVDYNAKIDRVFFCFRCFIRGNIRRKTKQELQQNFSLLQEALQASCSQ